MTLEARPYPLPENEIQRQTALRSYRLLDSAHEEVYDDFTQLAAYICDTPIAMINLIEDSRQWVKARHSRANTPFARTPSWTTS